MAFLAVAWFLAVQPGIPDPSDLAIVVPAAYAEAGAVSYAPGDVLVEAFHVLPYHFNRALGWLARWGWDMEFVWNAVYILALAISFKLLLSFVEALSGSKTTALLALVLIVVSPPLRGGLNVSWVPLPTLVSQTAAYPLGLLALNAALGSRWGLAFLMAGLSFNLHPALSVIVLSLLLTYALVAQGLKDWRLLAKGMGLWAATAVPTVLYMLSRPAQALDAGDFEVYEAILQVYTVHASVEAHFQGYGWFFLALGAAMVVLPALPERGRLAAQSFLLGALVLMLLYLLTKNWHPAILKTYLMRVTLFTKPILFMALAVIFQSLPKKPLGVMGFILLMLALEIRVPVFAEIAFLGALWIWLGFCASAVQPKGLVILPVAAIMEMGLVLASAIWMPEAIERILFWAGEANVVLGLFVGLLARPWRAPARHPLRAEAAGPGLLPVPGIIACLLAFQAIASMGDYDLAAKLRGFRFETPPAAERGVVEWITANTTPDDTILARPGSRLAAKLRLWARRSCYMTAGDANLLEYWPPGFLVAYARLDKLGARFTGPQILDDAAYNRCSIATLRAIRDESGVPFGVWENTDALPEGLRPAIVYEDPHYVVADLRKL